MADKVKLKDTPYKGTLVKFRLTCLVTLSACGGVFGAVLIYFPENKYVIQSKKTAVRGLFAIGGTIILIVLLKLIIDRLVKHYHQRRKSIKKNELNSQQSNLNFEKPINCPTLQSETKETESRPDQVSRSPMPQNNGKTVRFLGLTTEDLVKRTFSGSDNEVWSEFIDHFESVARDNSWSSERSRRMLLRSFRGEAVKYAFRLPLGWQRDYESLKDKMDEKFGETAMKEKYLKEARLRCRQLSDTCDDLDKVVEDLYPPSDKR